MIDAPTEQFAVFYLILNASAYFLAVFLLILFRYISGKKDALNQQLQVEQIAFLAGGPRRVTQATLASLAQRGAVRENGGYIERNAPESMTRLSLYEKDLLDAFGTSALTPRQLYRRSDLPIDSIQKQLQRAGLVPTYPNQFQMRIFAGVIASLPTIIGIIRLLHRLPQHRPVALLGFLCLLPICSGSLIAMIPIYANQNGLQILRSLRKEQPFLNTVGYRKSLRLTPSEIGLAVALNGFRSLRESHLSRLADLLDPPASGCDGGGDSSGFDGGSNDGSGHSGGDAF
jgi:uncharacterized protein (TIGR04222 family)